MIFVLKSLFWLFREGRPEPYSSQGIIAASKRGNSGGCTRHGGYGRISSWILERLWGLADESDVVETRGTWDLGDSRKTRWVWMLFPGTKITVGEAGPKYTSSIVLLFGG